MTEQNNDRNLWHNPPKNIDELWVCLTKAVCALDAIAHWDNTETKSKFSDYYTPQMFAKDIMIEELKVTSIYE